MPLDYALNLLEDQFNIMSELFEKDDWKFYKFGQGGPYKRTLTQLQGMANDYDKEIFDRFGLNKEVASFKKLIVLCLSVAKEPKERYKNLDTFKRQIKMMRRTQ